MLVNIEPLERAARDESSPHYVRHLPILVLDLHSRCQCKCVMCDIWQRSSSHELSFELLSNNRSALQEMHVESVVLTGGEPLMHSRFTDICDFLRAMGIRVTLLTAGMSLAKHANKVAYGVDDVIVSLDGPGHVHDEIRGVAGAYDLLATGVLSLLSKRPEMQIKARSTVQKANHDRLCETVAAAQELDLSGISFLAADLTSTAFNRDDPWSTLRQKSIGLNDDEVNALDVEIERLISQYEREIASGYIAEPPVKLQRIADHFRAQLGHCQHRAPLCNAPWVSAVVGYDGSVRPCFFHQPIGSLTRTRLDAVVNSESGLGFRSSLDVERNSICRQCVCSLNRPLRGEL